jgi:hypothetical protein
MRLIAVANSIFDLPCQRHADRREPSMCTEGERGLEDPGAGHQGLRVRHDPRDDAGEVQRRHQAVEGELGARGRVGAPGQARVAPALGAGDQPLAHRGAHLLPVLAEIRLARRHGRAVGRLAGLALHRPRRAAASGPGGQERRGRLAAHHRVGDRVGVALVRIIDRADAAVELDASPLLEDVRRLVGGGVQIRGRGEGEVVAGGVGRGADGGGCLGRRAADVGADAREVVVGAEGPLDLVEVRQRPGRAGQARGGVRADRLGGGLVAGSSLREPQRGPKLHRVQGGAPTGRQARRQGALARRPRPRRAVGTDLGQAPGQRPLAGRQAQLAVLLGRRLVVEPPVLHGQSRPFDC